jgi:HAD superfamily hydrolase (TIGR01509 family)
MIVKAVIKDFDGVIVDSFREGIRRIKTICTIHNIPFTRAHHKQLTKLWGMPGVELLVQGIGIDREFAKEVFYPAWERLDISHPLSLVPRTREVLVWLRRNKIISTLLTSRNQKNTLAVLDYQDLTRNFEIISTKDDSPYRKPDPRAFDFTFHALAEHYNITKEECIFVGDTPADIEAGKAVDIETLLVQTGPYLLKHTQNIASLPIPLANVLNSIDDLPEWIQDNSDIELLHPYE